MATNPPSRSFFSALAHYGILHREGTLIGDADLLIAAKARVHRIFLATNNTRHFQRIPDLSLVNWLEPRL